MARRKTHCPKLDFKSLLLAAELHNRAGGDIDKILPALDDIIEEKNIKAKDLKGEMMASRDEQIKVLLEKMKGLLLSDYADAVDDSIDLLDQALTHIEQLLKDQPCKVKCAAIKTKDGIIFEAKNHAICLQRMKQAKVSTGRDCEQGFVTTDGKFVDRHEAAQIAFEAGQTKKLESPLFSEDLTGDWPWKKDQPRQPEKKERD